MKQKLVFFTSIIVLTFVAALNGVSQWVQTNGPYGGTVTSLAVNGADLFAGTATGGVFLSTNDGASWSPVNTGLTNTTIHALAVSGSNVFAGTDGGVFLTTDRGAHWTAVDTGLTDLRIESLTVSGTIVFATTGSAGSFVTTNQGATWANTIGGLPTARAGAFAGSGARLYAAVGNDSVAVSAIYYSTDSGNTWSATGSISPFDVGTAFIIEGLAISGSNLLAFTYGTGVLRSTDNGIHWQGPASGLSPSGNFYSVVVSGSDLFVGTNEGIFLSTDTGATWQTLRIGAQSYIAVHALAVNGVNLFAGTEQGAFLSSNNGATWTEINTGLTNSDINSLAVSGKNLIAGIQLASFFDHDGVISTDNGANWTHWNTNRPSVGISALLVRDKNVLAATDSGVFRSRDDGMTWTSLSDSTNFATRSILAFAQSDSFLFAASRSVKVLRSSDDGITWNNVYSPEAYGIYSLAANGPNICVAAPMISVSHDNGETWNDINDPSDANVIIASGSDFYAGGNGVARSTNGGATWITANTGLTDSNVTALFASGTNLFAGTRSGGVFLTTNNGANWKSVGDGLTTSTINVFAEDGKNLFAGTAGASTWHRPLSEMISSNAVATTPSLHSMIAAYPNPLTLSTTISFTSPESGTVHVTIVNMLGEEVSRVFDGALEIGERHFAWDAHGTAPGMYWCEVRMNGRVEGTAIVLER